MPDMRYAAGMDGGGTKTVLEARAPDGRVLLRERFGPLNHGTPQTSESYQWLDDPWPWEYTTNKEA